MLFFGYKIEVSRRPRNHQLKFERLFVSVRKLFAALRAIPRNTDLHQLFPSTTGTAISHDNYLDRVLKPLGVKAGIDVFIGEDGKPDSRLNFQVLRRTTGTQLQRHGRVKDVQALLRHTDAATTLKYYQKTIEESLVKGVTSWDEELMPNEHPHRPGKASKTRKPNA